MKALPWFKKKKDSPLSSAGSDPLASFTADEKSEGMFKSFHWPWRKKEAPGISYSHPKPSVPLPTDDPLANLPPAKRSKFLRYTAYALAVWGIWASGILKIFDWKTVDDGPKIPPHYDYTLKGGTGSLASFAAADCGKDFGHQSLKHFDTLLETGISGTKTPIGDAFVRAVWDSQYLLCAADLPGDQGGRLLPGNRIVVDGTMSQEPAAATEIYMIMYKQNLARGTQTYQPEWSLSQRQVHLQSFEAAVLTAQMSVAWQKKSVGQADMWNAMGIDTFAYPIMARFEKNVQRAQELTRDTTATKTVMEVASRLTFPEIFNDRGFADRYNNYLLNAYVREMQSGKLKGAGGVDSLEFGEKMGRVNDNFNSVSGAMAAPKMQRFGENKQMIDAFEMVEMFRKDRQGNLNAQDRNFMTAEKKQNVFGQIDMNEAIKDWQAAGFKGNFLEVLRHKAGLDKPVAADKAADKTVDPGVIPPPPTSDKPPTPVS